MVCFDGCMVDVEMVNDWGSVLVLGVYCVICIFDVWEGLFVGMFVIWGDGVVVWVDEVLFGGWVGWWFCGVEYVVVLFDVI